MKNSQNVPARGNTLEPQLREGVKEGKRGEGGEMGGKERRGK